MPQLTFLRDPEPAFEGQRAYPMKRHVDVNTRYVAQAGGISFGRVCVRAGDQTVRLPTGAGDLAAGAPIGISVRQEYFEQNGVGYADGEPIAVMFTGYIWVRTEGAVVEGTPVLVRVAAGGLGLGAFVGAGGTALPGARWDTATAGPGLAIVRLGG